MDPFKTDPSDQRRFGIPLISRKFALPRWQVFRDSMLRRIFFPGENVLSKETAQKDLVLLARGAVSIEIAGVGGHGNWC